MVYLGVDCIQGGTWCSIVSGEFNHYPFSVKRRDIADHVDRMLGLSYLHDRKDGRVLAVVRGWKRISIAGSYSSKTMARAIVMERTCSILEARGVVVVPVLLSEAAVGLSIPVSLVEGVVSTDKIAASLSKSNRNIFTDMTKEEKSQHSVSTMLALYNKKYSNIRGRIF